MNTTTKPTTQATRKYDCTNFVTRTHETAIVEFDTQQTHVTVIDETGRIVNMWNDDTTDASEVVKALEGLYLRISRIGD